MNYTNWTNVNTFNDWLQVGNTNSGGTFWAAMLYTFVAIVFMSFLFVGVEGALMVALFMGILIGMFLLYMDLVAGWVVGVLVGTLIAVIIYAVFSSQKSNIS